MQELGTLKPASFSNSFKNFTQIDYAFQRALVLNDI